MEIKMLKVNNLNSYYGKSHILQGVNIEVSEGDSFSTRKEWCRKKYSY